MPKYVLHYFDLPGRAELIRLLFHHANVEFEDKRMEFRGEEFRKLQDNEKLCPFRQIPILEVDDEVIAQSHAIAKYVANEFGLNGKTNLEKAKNDMLVEGLRDIIGHLIPAVFLEPDEEKKAALKKKFLEEQLPKGLKIYEERFAPQDGFFLGSTASLSDITFFAVILRLENFQKGILDGYPKLQALYKRVGESPNIKKYMESQKK